jgi:glycosyltransferase involved in cell wall biosynthesis
MISYQDYPHDKLEWVIIDDSVKSSAEEFSDSINGIKVRYYHLKKKVQLGKKRDLINNAAKGVYLINIDDDDFYPPSRVSHAVEQLMSSGKSLAGCSKMFMYYCKDRIIRQLGPYSDNHGTAATLAYTKEYTKTNFYFDSANGDYAEEGVFTKGFSIPMVQLDPMKTVLALSHTDNTIEKTMFLEEKYGQVGKTVKDTSLNLINFIDKEKHAEIYGFYSDLKYEYKLNQLSSELRTKMETQVQQTGPSQQDVRQRMLAEIQLFTRWHEVRASTGL